MIEKLAPDLYSQYLVPHKNDMFQLPTWTKNIQGICWTLSDFLKFQDRLRFPLLSQGLVTRPKCLDIRKLSGTLEFLTNVCFSDSKMIFLKKTNTMHRAVTVII